MASIKAPLPFNETQRLKTLRDYAVLDTLPEQVFDDLTLLVAHICQTPVALISLVDEQRQWFKSKIGLSTPEISRDISFCAHAILYADEVLEVRDAQLDSRFADNPLVTSDPHIRFYAGAPLVAPDGSALGTLCVLDHVPRELSTTQKQAMQALSRQVVTLLELRRNLNDKKVLEERTHLAVEAAPNAIVMVDATGRITLVNAQVESLFGYPRAELIGQMVEILVPERFRAAHPGQRDGFFADPRPRAMGAGRDLFGLSKDGREVPIEIGLNPLVTGEGTFVLASIIDISERKQAEARLREVMVLQRAILDNAGYAIIASTPDCVIHTFNPAAERMLGYSAAEMVGVTPALIHDPQEVEARAQQFSAELGTAIAPGCETFVARARRNLPNEYEWTYIRKDGTRFPVLLSVTALRDAADEITGFLGVAVDISRRKQAEQERDRLFNYALDMYCIAGFDGYFKQLNPAWEKTLGWNKAELLARPYLEFVHPDDREATTYAAGELVGGKVVFSFDNRYLCKDGAYKWISWVSYPLADEGLIFAVARDITERKRSEQFLRAKNDELKAFTYTVSHDLKAPLRGITGYAQELERRHKEGLTERAQFCIAQIITASKNLDSLIEDLLKYSRIDTETPTLIEVNLLNLVQGILRDRSLVITEQSVEVSVNVPPVMLLAWERGLQQVLANLIDNALKYSRHSQPPRLTIRAEDSNGICRIAVTDNGIGFDMKYHERIFGLFNRLVRADEFDGTGAGLAIVKKLMEKLGGSIRAESVPGQGATFFVELPISSAGESAP